MTYFNQ